LPLYKATISEEYGFSRDVQVQASSPEEAETLIEKYHNEAYPNYAFRWKDAVGSTGIEIEIKENK